MSETQGKIELPRHGPKNLKGVPLFDVMRQNREAAKGLQGAVTLAVVDEIACGELRAASLQPIGTQNATPMGQRELMMTGAIVGCAHSLPNLLAAMVLEFSDWTYGEMLAACWLSLLQFTNDAEGDDKGPREPVN